jgi:TonB family protein
MRLLLVTVLLFGSAFGLAAAQTADPVYEVCPVYEGDMGRVSPSIYGFDVQAPTARTASGTLAIETNRGWYRVPFGPVTLSEATRHYTDGTGYATTDTNYRSAIFFVNFGQPLDIMNWWVEKGESDTSDWKTEGEYSCYPPIRPDPSSPYNFRMAPAELTPYTMIPPGARPLRAKPVPAIERTDCAQPFADAVMDKQVQPEYPFYTAMPPGVSEIAVTILPSGAVGNATVFKSSGIVAFDIAAVQAAEASTYKPKIAYCRPTVGLYLFKVTYSAK